MKIYFNKKIFAFGIMTLFFMTQFMPQMCAEETKIDPVKDVIHWDGTKFSENIVNKQDIDITKITYDFSQGKIYLKMQVNGTIQTSDNIVYQIYYESKDTFYRVILNKNFMQGGAIGKNGGYWFTNDVFVEDNYVECWINILNSDISEVKFYGYAYQYSELYDTSSKYWVDFAPDSYFIRDTLYVNETFDESIFGWQYDKFNKIQNAVNIVNESGTIHVYKGSYAENIEIGVKGLDLVGENKSSTIIKSNNCAIFLSNDANNVNISGFKIQRLDNQDSPIGILISSNYNNIIDNELSSLLIGIWAKKSSGNKIINNLITGNSDDGIVISGSELSYSSDNQIISNYINNNKDGIWLENTKDNHISDNIISENNDYGILLKDNSPNNIVYHNKIQYNGIYGLCVLDYKSNNNIIYKNCFNLNGGAPKTGHAYDSSLNDWNKNYNEHGMGECNGNYWQGYKCPDDFTGAETPQNVKVGHDGICDNPYLIPGNNNFDHYPLFDSPDPFDVIDPDIPQVDIIFPVEGYIYIRQKINGEWTTLNEILSTILGIKMGPFSIDYAGIIRTFNCLVEVDEEGTGIDRIEFWIIPEGIHENPVDIDYDNHAEGYYMGAISEWGRYELWAGAFAKNGGYNYDKIKIRQFCTLGLFPEE